MKKNLNKWSLLLIFMLAFSMLCCACGSDSGSDSGSDDAAVEEQQDDVSQEFKNALVTAQDYSDTMYMSKAELYEQLTSDYGEGFPEDAAQYAIDNVQADWNYNALMKGKEYYEDMAMSKNEVYEQLVSDYGEQFTAEQAQYAVDHLDD